MEPLFLFGALGLLLVVKLLRADREARALERLADQSAENPTARRAAIERLQVEVKALRNVPASRLALARLYLADDRAEDSLLELERAGDDALLSERSVAERTTSRLLALVRLGRIGEAEAVLDAHPRPFLDEEAAALWADARAQVRLGRGDAEGALAVLESAAPVPNGVRAQVALTRLRALATLGRQDEQVWNGLRAQSREVLEVLMRRHAAEPAAQIARRVLDGNLYR